MWSNNILVILSTHQRFWRQPKTRFTASGYSGMTGQTHTWVNESGRRGLYLSALQSAPAASAVSALFVLPAPNYASEVLPISSKGKQKLFGKPHFKFCYHCPTW